jgi:hypothetical protein
MDSGPGCTILMSCVTSQRELRCERPQKKPKASTYKCLRRLLLPEIRAKSSAISTSPEPRVLKVTVTKIRIHELNRIASFDFQCLRTRRMVHVAATAAHRVGRIGVVCGVGDAAIRSLVIRIWIEGFIVAVGGVP